MKKLTQKISFLETVDVGAGLLFLLWLGGFYWYFVATATAVVMEYFIPD